MPREGRFQEQGLALRASQVQVGACDPTRPVSVPREGSFQEQELALRASQVQVGACDPTRPVSVPREGSIQEQELVLRAYKCRLAPHSARPPSIPASYLRAAQVRPEPWQPLGSLIQRTWVR